MKNSIVILFLLLLSQFGYAQDVHLRSLPVRG